MSNNIYDILSKLESIQPKQQDNTAKKPTYEQVKPRGSILDGIRLSENKGNTNEQ